MWNHSPLPPKSSKQGLLECEDAKVRDSARATLMYECGSEETVKRIGGSFSCALALEN